MSQAQELSSFNGDGAETYSDIAGNRALYRDERILAMMGKRQVLKRRFGFLSLFAFSCTILATWETALALFHQAFQNGGPAGLLYGFIIAWLCTMSVYTVIAEMASIAPIAGGQYFWVSILAPSGYKRFASYITGWLTSIAWVAVLATGSIFVGTIIRGLIILNHPNYVPQAWHGTLLCWAVIAVAVFINTVVSGLLPIIEGLILVFHVLGFVAVLIPLVYLAPHGSASSVFRTWLNEGAWPTQGLSFCVGFIGNVATFVGADAAVHMSEEIENAAMNVPRAIFTTMVLNGSTGLAMVLTVLFCLGDIDKALNTSTGFPFIEVFYNGTSSKAGATVMASLVLGLSWCAVIGFLATASRMTWSFARDRGLPFHRFIGKVEPRTHIPMVAIALVTVLPCLLSFIYIGSSTVFEDVVSLSTSGLYASYFIPCSLLLWRRTTGQIRTRSSLTEFDEDEEVSRVIGLAVEDTEDEVAQPLLVWGPCVLVTGVVIIFSVIYYCVWGKKQYKGPLVEHQVRRFARKATS